MCKFVKWMTAAVVVALSLAVGTQSSQANTFDFFKISSNSSTDLSGQLSVKVDDLGSYTNSEGDEVHQVAFTFYNAVGFQSTIARIYFDDGTLVNPLAGIQTSGPDVNYSQNYPGPTNLPGGNDYDFETSTVGFSAGAIAPPPQNGVDAAGEWVRIIFDLLPGRDYMDTISALALGGIDGGLRIGLHMINLADGESDGYMNNLMPIPLPPGLVLFLSGLVGIGFLGRYKAKRREPAVA